MTRGLSGAEASRRLAHHGPNALPEPRSESFLRRFARQFRSPLIYILLFALAFETVVWLREGARRFPLEGVAIGLLLVANALLGAVQDHRSDTALRRLVRLGAPRAWVVRDGREQLVASRDVVPGDLLRLEAGDRVHADAKLAEGGSLLLDESILTGEAFPIEKRAGDDLHAGTLIVRGKAHAEVTATGPASALGHLAQVLGSIEQGKTPLETRIEKLGRQLARAILLFALLLVAVGVWLEGAARMSDVVIFAVALAVAVVPEELPAVLTLTLALGVERMAKRNAVVRRLSVVEALGSVTVICTDKTGTLTEIRMNVRQVDLVDAPRALRAMVLASDADRLARAGDPLELALLDHAAAAGVDVEGLRAAAPRVSERPFDSAWKFLRATVDEEGVRASYLKGAPEVVLARCDLPDEERGRWDRKASALARDGHRVLALAWSPGEAEERLRFLGLVALWDPPRKEVAQSVREARAAGVRVVMVTGDHPDTARAVARAVGIDERDVFARVTPERKLRIVEALQAAGEIVAMTGDGVNDAPALKKADVGVAMGKRGSDVAREAASLVLLDDDFSTIVTAIHEGRMLAENVRKFLRFMFVIHVAFFLLLVGGAAGSFLVGLRDEAGALILPLTALQILWINMLADGPSSFALGIERDPGVMARRPAPTKGGILDRGSWTFILLGAGGKTAIAFAMLWWLPQLGYSILATQTAIFAYEYLGQVVFAYPSRSLSGRPPTNWALHAASVAGLLVLSLLLSVPVARSLLELAPVDARLAGIVAAATAVTWIMAEAMARWLRRGAPRRAASARLAGPAEGAGASGGRP